MAYFSKTRNIELSIIKYIEDQIAANWTGVSVVKAFKQAYDVVVPVVCVRLLDINTVNKEVGSTSLKKIYGIIIDIFAKSDGQRIDIADFLMEAIKDGCTYYKHSHVPGDNSRLEREADGRIGLSSINQNQRVDFFETDLEVHDRFRHLISFQVRKG